MLPQRFPVSCRHSEEYNPGIQGCLLGDREQGRPDPAGGVGSTAGEGGKVLGGDTPWINPCPSAGVRAAAGGDRYQTPHLHPQK